METEATRAMALEYRHRKKRRPALNTSVQAEISSRDELVFGVPALLRPLQHLSLGSLSVTIYVHSKLNLESSN